MPAFRCQQLELNRPTNTDDKAIDIILVGVVFILHILCIRCDGKIIIESIADGKTKFCKNFIICGGPKTYLRFEGNCTAAFVIITIHPLVLIGSGQNATDGKLVCDIIQIPMQGSGDVIIILLNTG